MLWIVSILLLDSTSFHITSHLRTVCSFLNGCSSQHLGTPLDYFEVHFQKSETFHLRFLDQALFSFQTYSSSSVSCVLLIKARIRFKYWNCNYGHVIVGPPVMKRMSSYKPSRECGVSSLRNSLEPHEFFFIHIYNNLQPVPLYNLEIL